MNKNSELDPLSVLGERGGPGRRIPDTWQQFEIANCGPQNMTRNEVGSPGSWSVPPLVLDPGPQRPRSTWERFKQWLAPDD